MWTPNKEKSCDTIVWKIELPETPITLSVKDEIESRLKQDSKLSEKVIKIRDILLNNNLDIPVWYIEAFIDEVDTALSDNNLEEIEKKYYALLSWYEEDKTTLKNHILIIETLVDELKNMWIEHKEVIIPKIPQLWEDCRKLAVQLIDIYVNLRNTIRDLLKLKWIDWDEANIYIDSLS